jgi:SAM-dependent methyltransferase
MTRTPHPQPGLASAFARMLRESIRYRGVFATLKYLGEEVREIILDTLPERRRSRFGDIDYDCDFGVDTTWARLPWRVRLRELTTERLYQPSEPQEFRELMSKVMIDFADYTFIDLGSGKGRALLLASEYPFRKIIGVEIQRDLHDIAEQNIARFSSPEQKCSYIVSWFGDARNFEFPNEPLLVYLFNPFPEYVFATVLANVEKTWREHPRPIYIVYNTPLAKSAIEGASFLQKLRDTDRYQLYRARTDRATPAT